MAHVFISYAPENYEYAEVVQLRLERAGFAVWIDADQGEIAYETMVAKNWRQEIDDAIRASFALIAIITPHTRTFEYVNYEWMFALGFGVRVIPLLFEPSDIPVRLTALPSLDFCAVRQRPWDRLMSLLKDTESKYQEEAIVPTTPQRPHEAHARIVSLSRTAVGDTGNARTLLDLIDILRSGNLENQTAALHALVDLAHIPMLNLIRATLRDDDLRVQFTQELIETGLPLPPSRHAFLSYSRKDTALMARLRDDMRGANLQVWTDESLTPGDPSWQLAIENALEDAGCVVVILTPDAKKSEWVLAELQYAKVHKIVIVPVLMRGDEIDAIPMAFINSQWLDLRTEVLYQMGLPKLVGALQMYLQRLEERKAK